jgi:hypothetical protein
MIQRREPSSHPSRIAEKTAALSILSALILLTLPQQGAGGPVPASNPTITAEKLAQNEDAAPINDPTLSKAIQGVISDQMAAFRRNDAQAAFDDATPFIQDRFQQPDIFMQVVRNGYAPVYRPQQVEFRDLVQAEGGLEQRVFVIGPDGRAYLAHYQMQHQPDGSWKINGCILEPLSDQST